MARVFISYSRVDKPFAEPFAARLHRLFPDVEIWYDDELHGGDVWWDEILKQIALCDVFIYLLSNESVQSPYCQAEFTEARRLQKRVVTVQVRDRTDLTDDLDDIQYVDMKAGVNDPDAIARLGGAIRLQLARARKKRPLWQPRTPKPVLAKERPRSTDAPEVETPPLKSLRPAVAGSGANTILSQILIGLFVTVVGGLILVWLVEQRQQPPVSTNTPSASVTTAGPAAADNPTATTAPPLTPTERPTLTHTPTTPPTLSPEQLALTPVARNADWTPYERDFSGVTMMLVPAGCFMMGSEDGDSNEQPIHEQCFEQPFWIDKFEVTNAQFALFNGIAAHNGNLTGDGLPREMVNWFETQSFCEQRGGRLPTEREWEYAARGPDNLAYPWGEVFAAENTVYADNSNRHTFIVGSRSSGASWVGTQDLSGNVWEWTNSLYKNYPYIATDGREQNTESVIDIQRVLRGGSFDNTPLFLRTMSRFRRDPYFVAESIGFRCARDF